MNLPYGGLVQSGCMGGLYCPLIGSADNGILTVNNIIVTIFSALYNCNYSDNLLFRHFPPFSLLSTVSVRCSDNNY